MGGLSRVGPRTVWAGIWLAARKGGIDEQARVGGGVYTGAVR